MYGTKGGIGKTTFAVQLASHLACVGQNVVLCDFDPQCNTTSSFPKTGDSVFSFDNVESNNEYFEEEDDHDDQTESGTEDKMPTTGTSIYESSTYESSTYESSPFSEWKRNEMNSWLKVNASIELNESAIPQVSSFPCSNSAASVSGSMESYMTDIKSTDKTSSVYRSIDLFRSQQMEKLDQFIASDSAYNHITDGMEHQSGRLDIFSGSVRLRELDYYFESMKRPFCSRNGGFLPYLLHSFVEHRATTIVIFDAGADQCTMNEILFCNADYVLTPLKACMFSCTGLVTSSENVYPNWIDSYKKLEKGMVDWIKTSEVLNVKKYLLSPTAPRLLSILLNDLEMTGKFVSVANTHLINTILAEGRG